ncbi:Bgt-51469 [Blumeria graminis f. sp. tritici]|uniref:Bgt-51469 n=1 Tax=Blumeria graminis f. sp. tritici TaxID=62690 RepID=A0A9X9MKX9_BLUGR|nr:Bgt-51469 [Blumeria graminis f. sp. tritici]
MQRIHSFLIASLLFIFVSADNQRTFQCHTRINFGAELIQEKLTKMRNYYESTFHECRSEKFCMKNKLRKMMWHRSQFKGDLGRDIPADSMALWLPIKSTDELTEGRIWDKWNIYKLVALCTERSTCTLDHITERERDRKSLERKCFEI